MTIKEWEKLEVARIIRWVDKWIENNARNPVDFPLDLDPGAWEEQFTDGIL
jgi:hypothetical protein